MELPQAADTPGKLLQLQPERAGQLRVEGDRPGPAALALADDEGGMVAAEGDVAGLQVQGLGDSHSGPPQGDLDYMDGISRVVGPLGTPPE